MSHEYFEYVGLELDLFARASNWRSYWSRFVSLYLGRDVLEVGAGIGSATLHLRSRAMTWTALEPDENLARQIPHDGGDTSLAVVTGSISDMPRDAKFDTVLYIDVLEHIENDRQELLDALARLRSGGRLIVLAPAHQWLFSPFDAAVGHFRRYSKRTLRNIAPARTTEIRCLYLDSLGIVMSAANRLLLRSSLPTPKQIRFWDRRLIPVTRVLDVLTAHRLGKSVLMVWQKN